MQEWKVVMRVSAKMKSEKFSIFVDDEIDNVKQIYSFTCDKVSELLKEHPGDWKDYSKNPNGDDENNKPETVFIEKKTLSVIAITIEDDKDIDIKENIWCRIKSIVRNIYI